MVLAFQKYNKISWNYCSIYIPAIHSTLLHRHRLKFQHANAFYPYIFFYISLVYRTQRMSSF